MDKKQASNRSGQPLFKGCGAEKKGQDVANKPWPRGNGRRREPTNGTFSKSEPNRKPVPQKFKSASDKRPKPRSNYYAGSHVAGMEEAGLIEEPSAELGSVFVQGSKKQSLNHLLNFHYMPRQGGNHFDVNRSLSNSHRWLQSQKHKYNKEEFLQANCQFVVNSNGNYEIFIADPDKLVDWDLIEQVHVQGFEFPTCPICLYSPVAAKMTRCGHIYCWSCILHYLALSDKTWRKCPICYEAIHKQDLKSVVSKPHCTFGTGETITFRLMKRERGTLRAIPMNEEEDNSNILLNLSESKVNTTYSKLLLANLDEVMQIITREHNELLIQLSEDENCPEKCFIEQAIDELNARKAKIFCQLETSVAESESRSDNICEENGPKEVVSTESIPNSKDFFYFYQAVDGQHLYLHGLNVKMLEHTYGKLELCPMTISGQICEKQEDSMNEEIRKKKKYLQHLPITCQFAEVEIILKPPIVSQETYDHFKEDIEKRRRKRQRRARDERKHEKRVLEKENMMMGRYPTPEIHIDSHRQFPDFQGSPSTTDNPALFDALIGSTSSLSESSISTISEHLTYCNLDEDVKPDTSFAKMLSKPKSTKPDWWSKPGSSGHRPQDPPPKLITVTGAKVQSGFNLRRVVNDSDSDPEGYTPAPTYNQSFSEAIALALEQSASQSCNNDDGGGSNGKKKKKKQNRKLLFATTMAFNGK